MKVSSRRKALVLNRQVLARLNSIFISFTLVAVSCIFFLGITLHSSELRIPIHISSINGIVDGSRALSKKSFVRTKPIIAYVVSISSCGAKSLFDGAAVLHYSIQSTAKKSNRYDYQMYAIVHPDAEPCGRELEPLGYTIIVRDIPVALEEIQGEILRNRLPFNGCCGEKELIKLEAFTLTEHPIVVHMDIDTILMKPMDGIFDVMLGKPTNISDAGIMWEDKPLPEYIEAAFTKDYNVVAPKRRFKPVQGGLLLFRPSLSTYHDFQEILREGDFRNRTGWGGVVGPFYGAMTIQGILPFYYDYMHNGTKSLELNRCLHDSMSDNPRDKKTEGEVVKGHCRTGGDECEDCRARPMEDIHTFHFTCCQKPWWCLQLVRQGKADNYTTHVLAVVILCVANALFPRITTI